MSYVQSSKSDRRGIPIDILGDTNSVNAISGETASFYYNSAGTLTADAGQTAGVVVVAKLAYNHILNKLGGNIGVYGDTSLSFTSTAFTTEINVGPTAMEDLDGMTEVERLVYLAGVSSTQPGPFTANGQYFVDYNRGIIYGKKATTQVTLTSAAYSTPASNSAVIGTVTVVQPTAANLNAQVVGNVAAGASDSGNPVKTGGKYNTTPPTLTNGQRGDTQLDAVGNTLNSLGTTIAGEQVTLNYLRAVPSGTPTYISTATTTLVKSGAGVLTELVIGKHIATGVIQIYDGLTAVNLVATITTGAALLNDPPFSTLHGMVFNTGLTIVTSQAEFVTAMTI